MRWFLIVYILLLPLVLNGQTASKADELFNKKDYLQAAQAYQALLKNRPNDALYNYRYARCSYELREYDTAIRHFQRSGTRYPLTDYYLADSYFHTYRFVEAVRHYTAYAESAGANPAFLVDTDDKLRRATIGARLLNRVEQIEITDSMVVSKRDFLSRYELGKETGTVSQNSFYKEGTGWIDLIEFITQRGNRKLFSDTTQHSIDLFSSNKLLNGWSKAEALSTVINTGANENYPFLMLDGMTLYYASDGEGSLGGYDIFVTRFSGVSNDYLNPDNIGFPFNSLANDYMLVIDESNHAGWFVSDRFQPRNKVAVYRFIYTGEKKFLVNDSSSVFIDAATLRSIRWSEQQPSVRRKLTDITQQEEGKSALFRITDNLVYTESGDFRSPEAKSLFLTWLNLREESVKFTVRLTVLRTAFSTTYEELERAAMSREMLALERQLLQWRRQIDTYEKKIRNEEIKFLKKSDVM